MERRAAFRIVFIVLAVIAGPVIYYLGYQSETAQEFAHRDPINHMSAANVEMTRNGATMATWSFLCLSRAGWMLISCRICPSLWQRVLMVTLSSFVGVFLMFPLACAIWPAKRSSFDGLSALLGFILCGPITTLITQTPWLMNNGLASFILFFGIWPIVPLTYDCLKGKLVEHSRFIWNLVISLNVGAYVAYMVVALFAWGEGPFASVYTTTFVLMTIVMAICSSVWVVEYAGSTNFLVLTLLFPPAGLYRASQLQEGAGDDEKELGNPFEEGELRS